MNVLHQGIREELHLYSILLYLLCFLKSVYSFVATIWIPLKAYMLQQTTLVLNSPWAGNRVISCHLSRAAWITLEPTSNYSPLVKAHRVGFRFIAYIFSPNMQSQPLGNVELADSAPWCATMAVGLHVIWDPPGLYTWNNVMSQINIFIILEHSTCLYWYIFKRKHFANKTVLQKSYGKCAK